MFIYRLLICCTLFLINSENLFSQSFSIKGQLWLSSLTGDNIPSDISSVESNIGYIPTVSLFKNLENNKFLDLEFSYQLNRIYSGDSLMTDDNDFYRYWIRYSTDKLEARLGLQKIVFGPSQVLSSLFWFDSVDLQDPKEQVNGVEALRIRWYPSNLVSLWTWVINEDENMSFGGRGELSSNIGEWGLSWHKHSKESFLDLGGFGNIVPMDSPIRIGIDYRYDGFVGFWNENSMLNSDNFDLLNSTLGADYTLPIFNGILIMGEYMFLSSEFNDETENKTSMAFMASTPIGMIHQLMFISSIELDENRKYNHLRWTSTYDDYSMNFILSENPERIEYDELEKEYLPNTISANGLSFQIMFIYNH